MTYYPPGFLRPVQMRRPSRRYRRYRSFLLFVTVVAVAWHLLELAGLSV